MDRWTLAGLLKNPKESKINEYSEKQLIDMVDFMNEKELREGVIERLLVLKRAGR